MAYTKTQWVNNQAPAIDATNLNKIEQGIYDAHTSKQDTLISGSNIKTVNGQSVLGSGDLSIETGGKVLPIDIPSFSSLPQTVTDARITSDMVAMRMYLSNTSAITSEDLTFNTGTGTLTVSGSISGSTTLTVYLEEKM